VTLAKQLDNPHLGASIGLAQASACAATKKKFAFSCIRYVEVK